MPRKITSTATIKNMQDDLKQVYKTLYQGNGKPSIITQLSDIEGRLKSHNERLSSQLDGLEVEFKVRTADMVNFVNEKVKNLDDNLESKIHNLEKEMELKFKHIAEMVTERFNNISVQISSEFGRKRSESTNLWNFKTAVTTAILASFTSVFVVLLAEFLKRING